MHIAITGSIGSGKSEVASILRDLGYTVLSADAVVDTLYQSDLVKSQLVKILGSSALTCMNDVDKAYVSFRIFNDSSQRKKIEALIHPLVYQTLIEDAKRSKSKLIFSEVPLLFESEGQAHFDGSLLISCDEALALERLEKRGLSQEEALRRLRTQMPLSQKRALATDEIENNTSQEALREKVIQYLHSLTL